MFVVCILYKVQSHLLTMEYKCCGAKLSGAVKTFHEVRNSVDSIIFSMVRRHSWLLVWLTDTPDPRLRCISYAFELQSLEWLIELLIQWLTEWRAAWSIERLTDFCQL